ncbi:uroporphyrinogen decarboxylase family protein [Geitlerinema calcuttense NRMC-F 0142]|uniref:Uroporphyrinogen decarboxylase family protein n=2 Tax=Geitlerinema TaxID=63132 RepID=A0ABT7M0U8_9CYAN|nr:uroporphyrinogen decarboxylase family protein [Geitlerinema calcuttense NRMC-F 0142]
MIRIKNHLKNHMITPREIVYRTLNFDNPPRPPRDMWDLPLSRWTYPGEFAALQRDFPSDIQVISPVFQNPLREKGDPYEIGIYTDSWGCDFENIQRGVIGEVKNPPLKDWATDRNKVHIPTEWLSMDTELINRQCAETNRFTLMGHIPRPFEQLQFIRGTAELYMDLADPPTEMLTFLKEMRDFYCEYLMLWAKTDVDALFFMDDWGSQKSLLISPKLWREFFKPIYRDFAQIAHSAGKKIFMHSDGCILDIYPDLVEIGIDALNSQIFACPLINWSNLPGKSLFGGEIDRQDLLVNGPCARIDEAVRKVHRHLWKNGGCFAHCSFDAGSKPPFVRQVYESWNSLFPSN